MARNQQVDFPKENEISLFDLTYKRKIHIDHVIDINFGFFEYYGSIHIYCLNIGASLDCRVSVPQDLPPEKHVITNVWGSQIIIY